MRITVMTQLNVVKSVLLLLFDTSTWVTPNCAAVRYTDTELNKTHASVNTMYDGIIPGNDALTRQQEPKTALYVRETI